MAVMDTFAKRLKLLREERKLSQTELANALGISRGSLSFYENAERTADIETLYKVSEYFNVTLDYLLGKSDNRTTESAAIGTVTGLSDQAIDLLSESKNDYFIIKTINTILEQEALVVAIARYFFTAPAGGSLAIRSDGSLCIAAGKSELPSGEYVSVVKTTDLIYRALADSIKNEVDLAREQLQKAPKWWAGGAINADDPKTR